MRRWRVSFHSTSAAPPTLPNHLDDLLVSFRKNMRTILRAAMAAVHCHQIPHGAQNLTIWE
jgi:hypothetical protein